MNWRQVCRVMGYIEKIVWPIFGQPQAAAKTARVVHITFTVNSKPQKDKGYLEITAIGFQHNKRNAV